MRARAIGECNRATKAGQGALRLLRSLCALALLSGHQASAAPEDGRGSREAERLFAQGLNAYEGARWRTAIDRFHAVAELPANQRSRAALLMLGRSLLRLGDAEGALEAARRLLRASPGRRYAADARMISGDGYYGLGRHDEAAFEYVRVLEGPAPAAVQASAAERLAGLVKNRSIDRGVQDRIRRELGSRRMSDALLYGEARWYGRLGWLELSRRRLSAYVDSLGEEGMFHDLARSRLEGGSPAVAAPEPKSAPESVRRPGAPRLGVLAPLSGREGLTGSQLLDGVRFANEEMGRPFRPRPHGYGRGVRRLRG